MPDRRTAYWSRQQPAQYPPLDFTVCWSCGEPAARVQDNRFMGRYCQVDIDRMTREVEREDG